MVLKIISFSWNQGIRAVLHFIFFEWRLFICCCKLSTGCCWPSAVAAGYQLGAVDPVMLLQGIKLVLLTRCCCCRISINRVLLTQCSCCRVSTAFCWPSAVVAGYQAGVVDPVLLLQDINRVLLTQCCCCRVSTGCCWRTCCRPTWPHTSSASWRGDPQRSSTHRR